MKGKLYGIGVGPGDPELMTLKAVRIIEQCPFIAVPSKSREEAVSYNIARRVVGDLDKKTCLALNMPMTKDEKQLKENHMQAAKMITDVLDQGKDVAFLTLGDPTIYSTYSYIHKLVGEASYSTEIISGIPSFCAVSARLNESLVEKAESLHIIPSSYGIEKGLELDGTKVLMKAGKKMPQVKASLEKKRVKAVMIENCGMEQEKIYPSVNEIPDEAGYYALIIVKEEQS